MIIGVVGAHQTQADSFRGIIRAPLTPLVSAGNWGACGDRQRSGQCSVRRATRHCSARRAVISRTITR